MRIVSLLPALTEWIFALRAGAELVGRSHECDFPAEVRDVPVVTRDHIGSSGTSVEIDDRVRGRLQDGLSLYDVNLKQLRALRPDVILTQDQCAVCAVSLPQLEASLADWMENRPQVFSIQPMRFKQVLDAALRLGRLLDRTREAMHVVAQGEHRLRQLHTGLGFNPKGDPSDRPTVACIEWLDPLMTAGHWMPDVVDLAGGRAVLAEAGTPSHYITWDDLRTADPDVLAIMPCGFTRERTLSELHVLTDRPGWRDLRAVRTDRVTVFDGNAYFNRPGPRLYRSVELLARALYPVEV